MIFRTGGENFSGFNEMRVFQSMETLSDGFSFRTRVVPEEIKAGSAVQIIVADKKRITGFYDIWEGTRSKEITIKGKDKAGRLMNTFPQGFTGEFIAQTPKQIIESLVAPFGITVSGLSGDIIKRYNFRLDKTNARNIQKICTRAGLLANSDANGNLVLTDSSKVINANFALVEGQNIHDQSISIDLDKRHSNYNVYAQSPFANFFNSEKVLQSQVGLSKHFSPFNKIQSAQYEIADAKREAIWQQQFNDGSAIVYQIVFAGILDAQVNTLVSVASDYLGVSGNLLIRDLEFVTTLKDTLTIFNLVSPLTYGGTDTTTSHVI